MLFVRPVGQFLHGGREWLGSSEGTEGLEFQHFSSRVRGSPERAELEIFHDYCFSLVISFIILLLQLSLCLRPGFLSTFQTVWKEKRNEANSHDFPNFAFGHDSEF